MTHRLYESMFLLDNTAVRESWQAAKEAVTATIEKHGGQVHTARHWGERRLTYPIARRNRATYLLSYCDLPTASMPALRRELELSERVLRYLITHAEEVPAEERELTAKESSGEVVIPEPPADDAREEARTGPEEERGERRERGGADKDAEEEGEDKEDASEAGSADAPRTSAAGEGAARAEAPASETDGETDEAETETKES